MFTDIVFPKNNEAEFIKLAERLGIKSLVFAYESESLKDKKEIKSNKIKIFTAAVSGGKNTSKSKHSVDIIISNPSDDIRKSIEEKPDIIFGVESKGKRDFVHQRNSGFNQILCKIAESKRVIIGVQVTQLINSNGMLLSQIAGRIYQNITLCRKFKNEMLLASFAFRPYEMRAPSELQAIAEALGMTPLESKKAISAAYTRILENHKKKAGIQIAEGAEFLH